MSFIKGFVNSADSFRLED